MGLLSFRLELVCSEGGVEDFFKFVTALKWNGKVDLRWRAIVQIAVALNLAQDLPLNLGPY